MLTTNSESISDHPLPRWYAISVPMLCGPLRGQRWLPFSGGKIVRLLLGSYEPEQSAAIQQMVAPGDVFYDVGAAVGYYSLLAAMLVGRRGRVMAFEPDARNAAFLRRHVMLNGQKNVTVHQVAVSNREGCAQFACGTGTGTGHLSDAGDTTVSLCRLDGIAQQSAMPTHIKIDVEGAELQVLEGATRVLAAARPVLFLSLHGEAMRVACRRFLSELDYDVQPIAVHSRCADELLCVPVESHLQNARRAA
jgi:FkbM family methyltransferase